ncbi:MAG: ATP-grasp domain-containing protein [Thermoleophilia bacterium]|nr:ATP-grasp domain-containing protein [Thermoleophilia bacterium]
MKLAVVGGKLQGTEAVYLARKAGYETVLVDRREGVPASGLADRVVVLDVTADERTSRAVLGACDAVLPACEDDATLAWLDAHVSRWGVPLLFDLAAYRVTSSKLASNRLAAELAVPGPRPWPECGFPAVVKPSSASGSEGVTVVRDEAGLAAARARLETEGHEVVVEEYVAGPSLSVEVLAAGGRAVPLQVTGLEFDGRYDCKRVVAPVGEAAAGEPPAAASPTASSDWSCAVPAGTLEALDGIAVRLAEGLGLTGLMDVEVMVAPDGPRLLEIDARLPSQTPTAVLWSSGVNLLEGLVECVTCGAPSPLDRVARAACVYQHVHAEGGCLAVLGEHVMGSARPLRLVEGFCGADEALTDHEPGALSWSATLICAGATVGEARARADAVARDLARREALGLATEETP